MSNPRAALAGREMRQITVEPVELRTDDETGEASGLVGYASVTETPYVVHDWLGDYTEVIRSGAFTKTLKEQDDVRLLLNHEGLPLARTKSGTLQLREILDGRKDPQKQDQTGLWVDADLDAESHLASDVRLAMKRGDLDQMSFAFQVTRQEWSPDYSQRDIFEVKLFDVSVVTYPASVATSAALRDSLDVEALDEDSARDLFGRLSARFAPKPSAASAALMRMQADSLRSRPA